MNATEYTFWLGAGTLGPGEPAPGIRRLDLDRDGNPTLGEFIDVGENPTFIVTLPNERLVVASELPEGRVSLVDAASGEVLGSAATRGADPCHLAALPGPDGAIVFVANYSSGTLTVHRVSSDRIDEPTLTVQYEGNGPDPERQASAHPHQAVISADQELLFVPDLGMDVIHVHRLADLLVGDAGHRDLRLPAGTGPRHLVQVGDLLVTTGELNLTVLAVRLSDGEVLSALPVSETEGINPDSGPSAIRLSRSGHVIVANRNQNALAVLRLERDGRLTLAGESHAGGVHPRDIQFTDDERYLIVANQWSDHLTIFEFDPIGEEFFRVTGIDTPSPQCLTRTD